MDLKITSKPIALCLQKLLPQIIHVDKYADKEGRTMFNAIHTIDNIIQNVKGQQNAWTYGCFQFNFRELLILSADHYY